MLPARRLYRLENVITDAHLDNMAKLLLVTGWMVTYSYVVEGWSAWYSGDRYEMYTYLVMRPFGPYAFFYWLVLVCNAGRRSCSGSGASDGARSRCGSALSRSRSACGPSASCSSSPRRAAIFSRLPGHVSPDLVDGALFVGTLSFFLFLFLLFLRFVPFIPIAELKELRHDLAKEAKHAHG